MDLESFGVYCLSFPHRCPAKPTECPANLHVTIISSTGWAHCIGLPSHDIIWSFACSLREALERSIIFSHMKANWSWLLEICTCQSFSMDIFEDEALFAGMFLQKHQSKLITVYKWQKTFKMAVLKDLMRVHYSAIDKEIWLFPWHTF